jgi:DNA-binding LacI/PurR family transcriptional regulator
MPVTLKEIAERVGKSVPTVSRALGEFPDISPETRREVQRVAREMGYEPSATALNLKKKRAGKLALILPATTQVRFSDPFFSEFITSVIDEAAQRDFELLVATVEHGNEIDTYLRHIRRRSSDGFIVIRTRRQDPRIDLLRQQGVPFVAFGRVEGNNDFHLVDEDGADGIRQVVDYLVELGHQRIACIAEPLVFTKAYHRLQGFTSGLAAHGLTIDPALVIEANFHQAAGRWAAQRLLELPKPPTAIVACNDLLALGAMSEAHARGLVIGRAVSIAGFDDIMLAEYIHPPLTTVHQPAVEFGARVAQTLMQVIHDEPVPVKQQILKPRLVVRQSCGPPALASP